MLIYKYKGMHVYCFYKHTKSLTGVGCRIALSDFTIFQRWSYVKASHIVCVYASTHVRHVMPQVSSQVYTSDRKIRKLFRPRGNGQKKKKDKMSSVLLFYVWFLLFLQSMFLSSYLNSWFKCCWQCKCRNMWLQFVYILDRDTLTPRRQCWCGQIVSGNYIPISLYWKINI